MAFNLASISCDVRQRPPRIILLGVEKIGKSTFAAGSDRPIFIPVRGEEGIDAIPVPQFPTCNRYSDVIEAIGSLYSDNHDYGTVCVDSVSALEPLVLAEVCRIHKSDNIEKVMGGYRKGYTEALNVWRNITDGLDALRNERNMACILIGHTKVKRFDSPDSGSWDQWQFDMTENAAAMLYRWADVILFANTKVVIRSEDAGFNKQIKRAIDITNGNRFLYTQKNPAYPSGGRGAYGMLPAEIPLNWNNFMDAVSAAVKQYDFFGKGYDE